MQERRGDNEAVDGEGLLRHIEGSEDLWEALWALGEAARMRALWVSPASWTPEGLASTPKRMCEEGFQGECSPSEASAGSCGEASCSARSRTEWTFRR